MNETNVTLKAQGSFNCDPSVLIQTGLVATEWWWFKAPCCGTCLSKLLIGEIVNVDCYINSIDATSSMGTIISGHLIPKGEHVWLTSKWCRTLALTYTNKSSDDSDPIAPQCTNRLITTASLKEQMVLPQVGASTVSEVMLTLLSSNGNGRIYRWCWWNQYL